MHCYTVLAMAHHRDKHDKTPARVHGITSRSKEEHEREQKKRQKKKRPLASALRSVFGQAAQQRGVHLALRL